MSPSKTPSRPVPAALSLAALFAAAVAFAAAQEKARPRSFEARGRVVCLLEEMKAEHQVEVPPVHEHLWGFRVDEKLPEGAARHYTLLRTRIAQGLFVEKALQGRELRLFGRVFPATALLEVSRFQWFKDGRAQDLYYWCEVCSIKQWDPGTCSCCQDGVELRGTDEK